MTANLNQLGVLRPCEYKNGNITVLPPFELYREESTLRRWVTSNSFELIHGVDVPEPWNALIRATGAAAIPADGNWEVGSMEEYFLTTIRNGGETSRSTE